MEEQLQTSTREINFAMQHAVARDRQAEELRGEFASRQNSEVERLTCAEADSQSLHRDHREHINQLASRCQDECNYLQSAHATMKEHAPTATETGALANAEMLSLRGEAESHRVAREQLWTSNVANRQNYGDRCTKLRQAAVEREHIIQQLQQQLGDFEAKHENNIAAVRREVAQKDDDIENLVTDVAKLSLESQAATARAEYLQNRNDNLNTQVVDLNATSQQKEEELQRIKEQGSPDRDVVHDFHGPGKCVDVMFFFPRTRSWKSRITTLQNSISRQTKLRNFVGIPMSFWKNPSLPFARTGRHG